MLKKRPKIILSNDDGIWAPGLKVLWEALDEANMADLAIIAPSQEKSGSAIGLTWDRPILIEKVEWENKTPAWSVDGTPADCIKMASSIILNKKADLIVSGINAGSNAGRNVLHSGTIGAVIEGVLRGIPGIALSCENGSEPNFHVAKKYIAALVEYCLTYPLSNGTFLNVNFPQTATSEVKGFKMTHQGKGRWAEDPILHLQTSKGPSYWLGGKPEESEENADCDVALLREGYMTAVPIHVHELTDTDELQCRRESFEGYFHNNNRLSENKMFQ